MRQLWLVRHGPTHARSMIGWTDRPADLSDGAALARLRQALPPMAPVISSDLIRAATTADALQGDRTRLPHDPRLREIHFGDWENRSFAEIDVEDPTRLRAFWEQAGDVAAPRGESWNQMSARVRAALDDLPETVVVVCHFGPILAALQRALGADVQTVFAQKIEPLSLTLLQQGADGWQARHINRLF